jgi:hypothetical protein
MRSSLPLLLVAALSLTACDKVKELTGETEKKNAEGSSIGYACRVSLKVPEDCMKENEMFSQTAILTGWKSADKDIRDGKLDPSMGKDKAAAAEAALQHPAPASAPVAASAPAPASTAKSGGKPSGERKAAAH